MSRKAISDPRIFNNLSTTLAAGVATIQVPAKAGTLELYNPNAANTLWFSWIGAAAANGAGSFPIPALGRVEIEGANGTLQVFSAGATDTVTAHQWTAD